MSILKENNVTGDNLDRAMQIYTKISSVVEIINKEKLWLEKGVKYGCKSIIIEMQMQVCKWYSAISTNKWPQRNDKKI